MFPATALSSVVSAVCRMSGPSRKRRRADASHIRPTIVSDAPATDDDVQAFLDDTRNCDVTNISPSVGVGVGGVNRFADLSPVDLLYHCVSFLPLADLCIFVGSADRYLRAIFYASSSPAAWTRLPPLRIDVNAVAGRECAVIMGKYLETAVSAAVVAVILRGALRCVASVEVVLNGASTTATCAVLSAVAAMPQLISLLIASQRPLSVRECDAISATIAAQTTAGVNVRADTAGVSVLSLANGQLAALTLLTPSKVYIDGVVSSRLQHVDVTHHNALSLVRALSRSKRKCKLTALCARSTALSDADMSALCDSLPALTSLDIRQTVIAAEAFFHLAALKHLQRLSSTIMDDDSIEAMSMISTLTSLHIEAASNAALTSSAAQPLTHLLRLTELSADALPNIHFVSALSGLTILRIRAHISNVPADDMSALISALTGSLNALQIFEMIIDTKAISARRRTPLQHSPRTQRRTLISLDEVCERHLFSPPLNATFFALVFDGDMSAADWTISAECKQKIARTYPLPPQPQPHSFALPSSAAVWQSSSRVRIA